MYTKINIKQIENVFVLKSNDPEIYVDSKCFFAKYQLINIMVGFGIHFFDDYMKK